MLFAYLGILFLLCIQPNVKQHYFNKKNFCIVMVLFLIALSMIRNLQFGDLILYRSHYLNLQYKTFMSLILESLTGELKDFGFYFFSKIFSALHFSTEAYFTVIAGCYCTAFGVFVYRYSRDPFLSLLQEMTLFLVFTFTGLRQTMAMSVLFFAYGFAIRRRLFLFLFTTFIAALFHSSALCFIPVYWLIGMRVSIKKHLIILTVAVSVSILAPTVFRTLIKILAWNEQMLRYAERETRLSWSGFITYFLIYGFCFLFRGEVNCTAGERQKELDGYLNCMLIGLCLQSFSTTVAEAFRLSFYFSMAGLVAVPNVIMLQKSRTRKQFMHLGVAAALIALLTWKKLYFNF